MATAPPFVCCCTKPLVLRVLTFVGAGDWLAAGVEGPRAGKCQGQELGERRGKKITRIAAPSGLWQAHKRVRFALILDVVFGLASAAAQNEGLAIASAVAASGASIRRQCLTPCKSP